jgi:uncharacterized protein YndB with AHSA1/START domain
MERVRYEIVIDAPRPHVWHVMLDDEGYRDWTSAFGAGSHYVGRWEEGEKLLFLAPDDEGTKGMVSRVAALRPNAFVSLEHLGIVANGVEDTTSEAAREWAPAREDYTLSDRDGGTHLLIEMDMAPEHRAMFDELWSRALERLRALAEGSRNG